MNNRIDWISQWQEHAPNFENGHASIDLSLYGMQKSLKLKPGAGFGDTSHPTTRLVLRLMSRYIQGKVLIDIGCGCGILSLAGLMNGACCAFGVDIDPEAIEHAIINSHLNHLQQAYFSRALPHSMPPNPLIVINMISSEQRIAWLSNPIAHTLSCPVIASGILSTERERYVEEVRLQRNWHLVSELQEGEWLAFLFEQEKK